MRKLWLLAALMATARAETYTLTLSQALDRALAQNPEVEMARMDELRAVAGVDVARDPFSIRVTAGSGLAYSNGFPLSIEGSAPAAFQARANRALFNKPLSYAVAQARQTARAAEFGTEEKRDEIAFRVASLYIDADRSNRLQAAAAQQVESLQRVLQTVQARVEEGRELAVNAQEADVNLLRARQRVMVLENDGDYAESSLAMALGYKPGDRVKPVAEERPPAQIPDTEQAALEMALNTSNEMKRLQSTYEAKTLEIKGNRTQRYPKVDLVAQYAFLTKYSNYDQYFAKFQRNNGQIGASIQIPLFPGAGANAALMQSESDEAHIKSEIDVARNRIALDLHQTYLDLQKADMARQLAQADLDLARSQVSISLAQMNEGRASVRQVEEARFTENEKWIALYDAQFSAQRARLSVLRQTGELLAALR